MISIPAGVNLIPLTLDWISISDFANAPFKDQDTVVSQLTKGHHNEWMVENG